MSDHDDSLEPSPAELGDTMTVDPGVWTPLDDIGTELYVYGDQPVDVAVQRAPVDDEVRQLRAGFDQIARLLDQCRGEKALRRGVQAVVDRARGVAAANPGGRACDDCGHLGEVHGDEGCAALIEMSHSSRPCPCLRSGSSEGAS